MGIASQKTSRYSFGMHQRVVHSIAILLIALGLFSSGASAVAMSHVVPTVAMSEPAHGHDSVTTQLRCADSGSESQPMSHQHASGSSCCEAMCAAVVLLAVFADPAHALSLSRAAHADLRDLNLLSHDGDLVRRPPKA